MAGPVKICSSKLTTCGVLEDGETVRLDLLDQSGAPVSVQFPFEQVEALAMTLPQLLTHAMQVRSGSEQARYVFPLGQWLIEESREQDCLIVTLRTTDGFEVSFGIPFDTGRALGWALRHEADEIIGHVPSMTN
jgi:hypothetical protein